MNIHADLVFAVTLYSASECVVPATSADDAPKDASSTFKQLSPEQQAAWRGVAAHFRSYVGPGDSAKIDVPGLAKSLRATFPFISRPDAAAIAAVNMAPALFDEIH